MTSLEERTMPQITWNTDVNAQCCPGEIVAEDGRTRLIDTDWDYPGTAQSFGWSLKEVQRCKWCKKVVTIGATDEEKFVCEHCGKKSPVCDHDATDGTVNCKACGTTNTDFITAAGDWLRDNDGATADDPGYFED
jgi:hypothetical protein